MTAAETCIVFARYDSQPVSEGCREVHFDAIRRKVKQLVNGLASATHRTSQIRPGLRAWDVPCLGQQKELPTQLNRVDALS